MSKSVIGRYVTAIDIGTTKICVLIADTHGREGLEIVGVGQHPSHGLKKVWWLMLPKLPNQLELR